MKRHTCIICGRKRYELYMKKVLVSSWACTDGIYHFSNPCAYHQEILEAQEIIEKISSFKYITIKHLVGGTSSENVNP